MPYCWKWGYIDHLGLWITFVCTEQVQHRVAESLQELSLRWKWELCCIVTLQGWEISSSKTCLTGYRSGNVWIFALTGNWGLVIWKEWGCQRKSNWCDRSWAVASKEKEMRAGQADEMGENEGARSLWAQGDWRQETVLVELETCGG